MPRRTGADAQQDGGALQPAVTTDVEPDTSRTGQSRSRSRPAPPSQNRNRVGPRRARGQRQEHLLQNGPQLPNRILHRRMPTPEALLVAPPLPDPLHHVTLLPQRRRVVLESLADDRQAGFARRPPCRRHPPVPRRRRVRQDLLKRLPVEVVLLARLQFAQPLNQHKRRISVHCSMSAYTSVLPAAGAMVEPIIPPRTLPPPSAPGGNKLRAPIVRMTIESPNGVEKRVPAPGRPR